MGAGNDWLQSAMALPQAGRRKEGGEGREEKRKCERRFQDMLAEHRFRNGQIQSRQNPIQLTSGPSEKLLKELGNLLEEGEEGLEWLLWGVMARECGMRTRRKAMQQVRKKKWREESSPAT